MRKIQNSIHPDDDLHYKKMGLKKGQVELWEDGARVDGGRGKYEWWYFDSHYPDGTILVIFFYSKMPIAVNGPIKPISTIELTLPDGRKLSEEVFATIEESHYSKESCDVKIGDCYCKGDLKHYDVVFHGKTMSARLTLDGTIDAWRSQTGSIFFGDNEEHYFAWLPAIPEGKAVADVTYEGKSYTAGLFGGAGTNALTLPYIYKKELPENLPEIMLNTIEKLRGERVDIHLGNHPGNNSTFDKRERQLSEGGNPFIDSESWNTFLDKLEKTTKKIAEDNENLSREIDAICDK